MRHNPASGIMGRLVGQRAIIACRAVKGGNRRHVDEVLGRVVVGAGVVTGADLGLGRGKERLQCRVGLGAKVAGFLGGRGVKLGRQAVDLFGVEHAIGFQIRDAALVAFLGFALESAILHHGCGFLALADLPARLLRLTIGEPMGGTVALGLGGKPQHQDIDTAIRFAIGAARERGPALFAGPRLAPCRGARLDAGNDRVGNVLVKIERHLWPPVLCDGRRGLLPLSADGRDLPF